MTRKAKPKPERVLNRGAVALKQCGDDPTQICRRTGASYPVVHNWLGCHRTPGNDFRIVLEKTYGIARAWWDEPFAVGAPVEQGALVAPAKQVPPKDPHRASGVEAFRAGGAPTAGGLLGKVVFPDDRGLPPPQPLFGPVDPRNEAQSLVAQIRRFRSLVDADPTASLSERAKVIHGVTRDIDHLFRLTGEAANIPEARILASPAWGRIKDALVVALEPHPDALADVVAALERFQ